MRVIKCLLEFLEQRTNSEPPDIVTVPAVLTMFIFQGIELIIEQPQVHELLVLSSSSDTCVQISGHSIISDATCKESCGIRSILSVGIWAKF